MYILPRQPAPQYCANCNYYFLGSKGRPKPFFKEEILFYTLYKISTNYNSSESWGSTRTPTKHSKNKPNIDVPTSIAVSTKIEDIGAMYDDYVEVELHLIQENALK